MIFLQLAKVKGRAYKLRGLYMDLVHVDPGTLRKE
jgi:hypothetical protein